MKNVFMYCLYDKLFHRFLTINRHMSCLCLIANTCKMQHYLYDTLYYRFVTINRITSCLYTLLQMHASDMKINNKNLVTNRILNTIIY